MAHRKPVDLRPSMKIGVLGLWHLGCVTAASLARHFDVVALDFDESLISGLKQGKAPLFEPGLDELIQQGLSSGRLSFHTPAQEMLQGLDLLWVTYDTPVDDSDHSDVEFVLKPLRTCVAWLPTGSLVAISSQLPAGTCHQLEEEFKAKAIEFASLPENLRLGQALKIFSQPDRIVAGTRTESARQKLEPILSPFSSNILWMRTESAEMTKHALNSFLALSITYMYEIANLCERVGADAREVSLGLKSDQRIGPQAYLGVGEAFAGGTLARDIISLQSIAKTSGEELRILPAIQASNEHHKLWVWRQLQTSWPILQGKTIAVFGLAYKPGTNTLRRSSALELCERLFDAGASVRAWDPLVRVAPPEWEKKLTLSETPEEAVLQADAIVIATPFPEFRSYSWPDLLASMRQPLIIDARGFLRESLPRHAALNYIALGAPHET